MAFAWDVFSKENAAAELRKAQQGPLCGLWMRSGIEPETSFGKWFVLGPYSRRNLDFLRVCVCNEDVVNSLHHRTHNSLRFAVSFWKAHL
jgi:hypothetical protein